MNRDLKVKYLLYCRGEITSCFRKEGGGIWKSAGILEIGLFLVMRNGWCGIFPELCVSCRREPLQHAEHSLLSQGHPPAHTHTHCMLLSPTHTPHLIGGRELPGYDTWKNTPSLLVPCDQGKGERGRQRKDLPHLHGFVGGIRFLMWTIGQLLRLSTGIIDTFLLRDPRLVLMDGWRILACHITAHGQVTRLFGCWKQKYQQGMLRDPYQTWREKKPIRSWTHVTPWRY